MSVTRLTRFLGLSVKDEDSFSITVHQLDFVTC